MYYRSWIAVIALLHSSPLLAYIDPGSGSALTAAILAMLSGIYFYIKKYYYMIKNFIIKIFPFLKK